VNQYLLAGLVLWHGTFALVVLDKFAQAQLTKAKWQALKGDGK
jgi:hypothetical protein